MKVEVYKRKKYLRTSVDCSTREDCVHGVVGNMLVIRGVAVSAVEGFTGSGPLPT